MIQPRVEDETEEMSKPKPEVKRKPQRRHHPPFQPMIGGTVGDLSKSAVDCLHSIHVLVLLMMLHRFVEYSVC